MIPIANAITVGPRVLPLVLAVGGATVAGSHHVRSRSRAFDRYDGQYNTAQSEPLRPAPLESSAPEPRSKYFEYVLESIFA
ncbi:hypothetical protein ACJZ2D_012896 [Fusarium nematophilum]